MKRLFNRKYEYLACCFIEKVDGKTARAEVDIYSEVKIRLTDLPNLHNYIISRLAEESVDAESIVITNLTRLH